MVELSNREISVNHREALPDDVLIDVWGMRLARTILVWLS